MLEASLAPGDPGPAPLGRPDRVGAGQRPVRPRGAGAPHGIHGGGGELRSNRTAGETGHAQFGRIRCCRTPGTQAAAAHFDAAAAHARQAGDAGLVQGALRPVGRPAGRGRRARRRGGRPGCHPCCRHRVRAVDRRRMRGTGPTGSRSGSPAKAPAMLAGRRHRHRGGCQRLRGWKRGWTGRRRPSWRPSAVPTWPGRRPSGRRGDPREAFSARTCSGCASAARGYGPTRWRHWSRRGGRPGVGALRHRVTDAARVYRVNLIARHTDEVVGITLEATGERVLT